ncbi:MAG TPA: HPr family phosphocarrier protein [Negativicutes bacterium]|nr:HPr family phosphocarrier protein [Negativicutes bacterium]
MLEQSVVVVNKTGLHARPAALLVKTAASFPCDVVIIKNGKNFNGKSIISVMSAAVKEGEEITVRTDGDREEEALEALITLIKTGLAEKR